MATKIAVIQAPASTPPRQALTFYAARAEAGFPSPADDYIEGQLDLNEHLIANPPATFFVRVSGQSMINAGIHDGDLLIVDRSVEPQSGSIVIAVVHGETTVKRLGRRGDRLLLLPENEAYQPLEVNRETGLQIWGVCRYVIHRLY